MPTDKVIIGNEEWCTFSELGIPAIKARVDSGAKTSALHAFNIQSFVRDNCDWVKFDVHPLQQNRNVVVNCEAPVCDRRWVKSSSGLSEKRYVVKVNMQVGRFIWNVEITLTNRDSMGYRMLLGRNAMQNHVLVDPSHGCYFGDKTNLETAALYAVTPTSDKGLHIGILGIKPNQYGNRRLLEIGKQRGHQVDFINIEQTSLQFSSQGAQCWQGNVALAVPDIIIPRFPASHSYYGCSLLQYFQMQGALAMNSANAIRQARDIISVLHIMQQLRIPALAHRFSHPEESRDTLFNNVGSLPVLIKSFEPDVDKPFIFANNLADINAIIDEKATSLVIREHQEKQGQHVIRSVVLHNRILASFAMPIKMISNETIIKPDISHDRQVTLDDDENFLVIRAAQAMNLELAGIDIIRTERGAVFYGLTPNPGFSPASKIANSNIAQTIIMDIEDKFQHKVKQHA